MALGVSHPVAAACAITLLDLLPLIGSGMILLPWGLWELCRGRAALGVGLWLLFGSAELLRAILEPRLLGAGAGLPPLVLTRGALCRAAAGRGTGGYAAPGGGIVPVGSGLPGEAALVPKGGHRQLTFLFQGSKKAPAPHRADAFGLFMPELSSKAGSPASSRRIIDEVEVLLGFS